ncbi:unnamed protein product [Amaranthus hypochondriacus]
MFCFLFSWRKASKCKKLIKKIQCRLKLLKSKRCVIATHFRQDIAQLWKNGYERIAYNRIDELCMDEGMILVYDILEQYSKFILLNLSYIRKHKDLPIDVNEAISTLAYASARCSDIPELRLIRKLFGERYGQRLIVGAVHLHSGNHVNRQVKEKLTLQSVSEYERNRMLHEIVKDFFFKPAEFLAHDYKLDCQVPPKVAELYEVDQVQQKCTVRKNICPAPSTSHCIVLQSSPLITEIQKDEEEKCHTLAQHESSVIEVVEQEEENGQVTKKFSFDDQEEVQEFKTPIKQEMNFINDQDQRFFLFGFSSLCDTQLGRSDSGDEQIAEYMKFHVYNPEKSPKEIGFVSDEDWTNQDDHVGEEIQEMGLRECVDSPLLMSKFKGSSSSSVSVSPSHVHPKLPDYDEIEAKFKVLKMVHLQNKIPADVVDGIYSFMKLFV